MVLAEGVDGCRSGNCHGGAGWGLTRRAVRERGPWAECGPWGGLGAWAGRDWPRSRASWENTGRGQSAGRGGAWSRGLSAGRNAAAAEQSAMNTSRRGQGASNSRHRERASVQGEFLQANRALRAEIEGLEAKIRRRDVVVDEERQVDFYRSRIPERVNSVAAFNHWRVEAERTNARLLYMSRADLAQRDAEEAGAEHFPDQWPLGGNLLPLEYKFEPAEPADGVTLVVPELLLDVVNAEQIAWLVPGIRLEKIIAVFRAGAQAQRIGSCAGFRWGGARWLIAAAAHTPDGFPPFYRWLAQWITQRAGSTVTPLELSALSIPDFLRMNLRVLDADDRVLAEGRDLLAIKRKLYAVVPPVSTGVAPFPRAITPPRGSRTVRAMVSLRD